MRTSTAHGNFQTPAGLQDRHQLAALDPWQCHASLVDHARGDQGGVWMGMGALVPQKAQGVRFGVVAGKQTPKRPFRPVGRKNSGNSTRSQKVELHMKPGV
jgi:hypothetical protein